MYGRDDLEWNELVDEADRFLREQARLGEGFTTYTDLNRALTERTGHAPFDFGSDRDRAAIGQLLGEVVQRTFPEMQSMLSAIVLYQGGSDAGSGFYRLAAQMGILPARASDDAKFIFWRDQARAAQEYCRTND